MGDLHIKMMLQEPLEYGVNRTLVGFMIQSFFELLWDHHELKLKLEVLQGVHNEIAFVEIKTSIDCLKVNRASLLNPHSSRDNQVFLLHVDAVGLLRA
jgi:hypothetical protein